MRNILRKNFIGFCLTIRKKCTLQSFKIKTPTNTQKSPTSVWQVTFFSAMRDAYLPPPFTAVLACVLVQHLGDTTSVSLGNPQFYDKLLLLLTLGQKLSDYQLLVNLLPQVVGACSLQVFASN